MNKIRPGSAADHDCEGICRHVIKTALVEGETVLERNDRK